MNKQEHLAIGIIAFFLYYFIISFIKSSNNFIAYAFIAIILGSIIPDVLEPPTSWMHRASGHSKRALKLTAKIFAVTAIIGLFAFFFYLFSIFYVISNFFLGYALHLLADSTTKVGLPD